MQRVLEKGGGKEGRREERGCATPSPHLCEVVVGGRLGGEVQLGEQLGVLALQQLVEDVEVPLSRSLGDHPRFLQKVVLDVPTHGSTLRKQRGHKRKL